MTQFVFPDRELVDDQWPPGPVPTVVDARTHALRALRRFIALLVFSREGNIGGPVLRFAIPIEDVHIYQPDSIEDVHFPAIGIRPGRGTHDAYGLGPPQLEEDSVDVFGPGTGLIRKSEWVEPLAIEILGVKDSERTAVKAGLEEALTNSQDSYALRLRLVKYFDQIAIFELMDSEVIEDDPVFRNRRRADLYVTLRVPEVALVSLPDFRPAVVVAVTRGDL